ncbi:MAG: CHAT domain-containing protein [Thermoanaerobaculia bacterium]
MEYQDFVVSIERDGPGAYRKRVLESPAGQGSDPFEPPFPLEGLSSLLGTLGLDVQSGRGLREIGTALYQALFSGQVGALYAESRGRAEGTGCGLRIKLRFDSGASGMSWVPVLPWELIYRPDTEEFLGSDLLSPIVRHLEVPRSSALPIFQAPLRILVALASPQGADTLDLEEERRRLEKALDGRQGEIEPDFLEHATLDGIRTKLRSRSFHVLHFMGHGEWNPTTAEGSLLLETADRNRDLVGGALLADVIKGTSMPVLVVLNACNTARSAGFEGASPFGGVAAALVRKGVPAVVAMQFPVTDDAALPFAGALYSRIAAGDPVDTAVTEGRMAIRTSLRDSMEWATPVLFMRTPDGRLFESRSKERQESPHPPPATEPSRERGLRIGTIHATQVNYTEGDIHQNNSFQAELPKR